MSSKKVHWGEYACCALISICLLGLFFPAKKGSGEHANANKCGSMLKKTGTATAIYMGDNNDRMPLANWMSLVKPNFGHDERENRMQCPQVIEDGKHFGYAMKAGVVGMDILKAGDTAMEAMYFETDALGESVVANLAARCARHRKDGSNVSFLDTHIRFVRLDASLR